MKKYWHSEKFNFISKIELFINLKDWNLKKILEDTKNK